MACCLKFPMSVAGFSASLWSWPMPVTTGDRAEWSCCIFARRELASNAARAAPGERPTGGPERGAEGAAAASCEPRHDEERSKHQGIP